MIYTYPAVFCMEDNGYSVIFPDFNNATCGDSFDEAMYMAMELLALNIHSLKENNKPLPQPSSLNEIDLECIASYIEADITTLFPLNVSCDADEYIKLCHDKGVHQIVTIKEILFNKSIDNDLDLSQVLETALTDIFH